MKENDMTSAKKLLVSLLHGIVKKCQKGIIDKDTRFLENVGFIDNSCAFIDFGEFEENIQIKEPAHYKLYIEEYTAPLKQYLENNYPELGQFFQEQVSSI